MAAGLLPPEELTRSNKRKKVNFLFHELLIIRDDRPLLFRGHSHSSGEFGFSTCFLETLHFKTNIKLRAVTR